MPSAVVANRLRDGEDVRLIECAEQRRAAMAARAEADQLSRVGQIGISLVIFTFKACEIDENAFGGRFAGKWRDCHVKFSMSGDMVWSRFIQYEAV